MSIRTAFYVSCFMFVAACGRDADDVHVEGKDLDTIVSDTSPLPMDVIEIDVGGGDLDAMTGDTPPLPTDIVEIDVGGGDLDAMTGDTPPLPTDVVEMDVGGGGLDLVEVDDACVAKCDGKQCGPDGCGGSCGGCPVHHECEGSACVYVPWCGDGSCDGSVGEDCGSCPGDCCAVPPDDPNELIADRHFTRGFIAMAPGNGDDLGAMNPAFSSGDPVWDLAQWGSLTSLDAVTPTTLASGAKRWEDGYGAVTIGPFGSNEADLSLRVNAFEEYGGVYFTPTGTQTWVHLLGAQRLSPPGAQGPGCPPLSQLASLDFSVDARLLFDQQNIQAGYNPSKHAASYLMYFTVQNLNAAGASGYGDYLWFGITLYDDRDSMPGLYVAGDDATGKLIYNIGLAPLSNASLDDQQWHSLSEDLLPHILAALQQAWGYGYLLDSQNLFDYRIGGMNLGWETPGLNNSELQIRDLSLIYTESTAMEVSYGFNTDGDTEGWTTGNINDINDGPVGGLWVMTVPGSDPVWLSPALQLDAASYNSISVTMANDGNPAAGSHMQIFWLPYGAPDFSEANSAWIDVSNGGGWATYTIDLAAHPNWSGQISQLRIDPIMYGDGHAIGVDAIEITP